MLSPEALQKAKAELAKVQTRAIDLDTTQGNNRLQALMNSGGFVNGRKLPLTALVAYAGIMRGVRIGGDEDDMSPSSHSQVVQWTPESASLTDQELYSAIAIHPESNSQEVNIETETAKDSVAADKRFSALGRSAFAQSGSNIAVSAGADAGWWGAKAGGGMNRRKSNGNAAEEEQKEEARRSVQTKSLYKTRYYLEPRLRIQLKASMLTPTSEFEEVIAELQERVCRTKHEDAPDKANNSDNADHCRKAASSKPTPPAPSIRGQRVLQVVFLVWNISHFDLVDLSPDVGGAVQARVESVIRKHCGLQQSRAEISIDVQLSKPDRSRGMDVVQHILDRADATEVLATIKLGNASAFSEAAANLKWAESHGFLEMDCLRAVKYTPHIDSAVVSGDINSIGIDAHSRPLAVVETTIPKTQDPEDEKVEGTPTETPSGELQLAMTGGPSLRSKPEVSESHRLQPVQTLRIHGPPSTPPKGSWERCACEAVGHWNHPGCTLSRNCACDGPVRYGFGDRWVTQTVSGSIECLSPNFEEDPYPNQGKECQCFKPDAVPAPTPPPSTTTPSTPAPSAPAPSAPAPSAPAPSTPPKSSERLQGDIESLLFRFGTHVCPQVVLGGWWKLAASYQSTEKHTEVDKSNVLSMAIEKTTVSAAQAHAEGSYGVAAGSAAGGTDNAEKVTETTNSGEREINKDAYKDANIEVTQEWRGGASGTSPADWRRSLDESFNSNWRVIDREIDNCVGVWTWVDDEELRSLICEHWLELYHASLGIPNVTEEDRSTVCHRDDGFRRMQSSMQIFEKQSCSKKGCLATATCPSGYQLMDCTGGASGLGLAITRTSCSLEAQYDFGATVEAACFRTDQPAHVQSQSFKEGWKYSGWVGDTWVGDAFHPVACPVGFSARLCTFRCDSEKEECIAPAAQPRSDGSCPSRCNEEWEQPVPDGLWCRGWTVFALCYPNDYQMTSGQISTYDHPLE
ncbi:unnamed protein product [Symbiodinium sp. CCMP2592]|nr:unnamed protein product [Symbiodinium sp. CCMP2592]